MRTKERNNLSGQVLIETLLILPPLAFFTFMFSFYTYRTIIETAILDLADQALICSTSYQLTHCKKKVNTKIIQLSTHIQIQKLNLESIQKVKSVNYIIDLTYSVVSKEKYQIRRELEWTY